eukprot:640712-Prymnesium_polylepis.3
MVWRVGFQVRRVGCGARVPVQLARELAGGRPSVRRDDIRKHGEAVRCRQMAVWRRELQDSVGLQGGVGDGFERCESNAAEDEALHRVLAP